MRFFSKTADGKVIGDAGFDGLTLGAVDGAVIVDRPRTTMSLSNKVRGSLTLPVAVVIVLFTLVGSTQNSFFFSEATWINILTSSSFTVIVACFEGLVIISGGLDLSVGATFLAGAMVSAQLVHAGQSSVVAILVAVLTGAFIGLVNGVLSNFVGIPPIIATLGTLFCITAIVTTLSGGLSIGPLPSGFTNFGSSTWGPFPSVIFIALAVAIVAHVLLRFSTFGIKIRAVGGNRTAAVNLGLNAKRISTLVYVMCGMAAAFSGVLQASNLGAGSPTFGTDLELQAIAAVVIGGVSVYGSVGEVPGMVLGAVLLSQLTVGLLLLHFSGSMQDFAVGLVLILAVAIDRVRQSRMFRLSRSMRTGRGK